MSDPSIIYHPRGDALPPVSAHPDAQGPPGPQGPQGPPGPGGGSAFYYVHDQSSPAATWSVNHNLSGYPNVTVVDSALNEVEGDVHYDDLNNVTVTFNGAFSGKAILS